MPQQCSFGWMQSMEVVSSQEGSLYDRDKEVVEFDQTKTGVKGLLDSGVVKIPRFFIQQVEDLPKPEDIASEPQQLQVPVIDLDGFESLRRKEIVDEIKTASETWGFFQVINHGVPGSVMEQIVRGARQFHEQPEEVKMGWYSRDASQPVKYFSNGNLLINKAAADWRDTLSFDFKDGVSDPQLFPEICREAVSEYIKHMINLRKTLAELLSEGLGLQKDHLANMECMETESLLCHYYPACPEPELTLGATKHSDPSFLTILLQDNVGGLQVLHQNHWVNVPFLQGALVINIGDFIQLISNEKFKSVEHRVLATGGGPRTSVACFFYPSTSNKFKLYAPLQELLSGHKLPIYRGTSSTEYLAFFKSKGLDGNSVLANFKLQ